MKKMILTSMVVGSVALSGCSTMKSLVGMEDTGMHDSYAQVNNQAPVQSMNNVLVDSANHMTLYTYDKDTANTSNCNTACTALWPAFKAPANTTVTGKFSTITRKDGSKQWALNGMPLYFYANDQKPGDMKGKDINHWDVVTSN